MKTGIIDILYNTLHTCDTNSQITIKTNCTSFVIKKIQNHLFNLYENTESMIVTLTELINIILNDNVTFIIKSDSCYTCSILYNNINSSILKGNHFDIDLKMVKRIKRSHSI